MTDEPESNYLYRKASVPQSGPERPFSSVYGMKGKEGRKWREGTEREAKGKKRRR